MRVACALMLGLCGCVTAQVAVPPTEAADLSRRLTGETRYLRVSMYQTPFFGDSTHTLLTAVPPELVRSLEDTRGKPINPGPVEHTFSAGRAVRIRKVEFPSALVMTERVLYTPRSLAWIYVELEGAPRNAPPAILVLRPGLQTGAQFETELERYLSRESQEKRLESFSEAVREAVRTKTVVPDMPAEALEMAWGYPEAKRVELEGTQRKETWRWADDGRSAVVIDGRAQRFNGANGASSSSSP